MSELSGATEYTPVDFEVRSRTDNWEIAALRRRDISGVVFVENASGPEAREQVAQLVLRASILTINSRLPGRGQLQPTEASESVGSKRARHYQYNLLRLAAEVFASYRTRWRRTADGIAVQPNEQISGKVRNVTRPLRDTGTRHGAGRSVSPVR
jgi:hypothetical protein